MNVDLSRALASTQDPSIQRAAQISRQRADRLYLALLNLPPERDPDLSLVPEADRVTLGLLSRHFPDASQREALISALDAVR